MTEYHSSFIEDLNVCPLTGHLDAEGGKLP